MEAQEPTGEEIRFATTAVAIPALISSKRSGVVANLTQVEFASGRWVNLFVVSVFEHKTGGPAKLIFNKEIYKKANGGHVCCPLMF